VPLPGKLDHTLGEFWVRNPWEIVANGHNLSAFERKRMYLNVRGKDFLDISHISGADNDGDGRSVVAADFRNVGMNDLVVRQAGGGALLLYENRMPRKGYLKVTLRGSKSNRQGIGARITAEANGTRQTREMYPHNSYRSQAPNIAHFGLADASEVKELTVRWPSGKVQSFKNCKANRHIVIDESKDDVEDVVPGKLIAP
jgi:hypothetical protein